MFIIYDVVFFIFALICLPLYSLQGKFHRGFNRRLGILPSSPGLENPIWIHAVSVGEVNAVKGLVSQIRKNYPRKKIVISTVTATGNKIASGLINNGDFLTYLPLDFSFIVGRVLRKVNPCLFIIAETEIWPNLITALYRQKIPVITVNGRISERSFAGYSAIKLFIRPILKKVSRFCMQSETDALRLKALGVEDSRIKVTGNVKFDIDLENLAQADFSQYRKKLWLQADEKLFVCGSTHEGEEIKLFNVYNKLLTAYPKLKLLIAPRHPQRSKKICRLAKDNGFMPILVSGITSSCPTCINKAVFILDIMGELFNYYGASDIVFIGGSLVRKGGHNIIEPASLKKPVIFGPNMFNFRDISGIFLKSGAAMMANNESELVNGIKYILGNDSKASEMALKARAVIAANKGATGKNIEVIKEYMRS